MQSRFGEFTFNTQTGELSRVGQPVRLSFKAVEVLTVFVARPGELITRAELRAALWPSDTFVDFDNNLNAAIRKLRAALGDSAESPRFIETLPKRGYRFLPHVDSSVDTGAVGSAMARDETGSDSSQREFPWRQRVSGAAGLLVFAALVLGGGGTPSQSTTVISVLPFVNVSGDSEQNYISEGLTSELTTHLAMERSYRVFGGSPTRRPKGTIQADFLVEGSTNRDATGLFVTARVTTADRGDHVWAGAFRCPQGDGAAIQRQLALKITSAVLQSRANSNESSTSSTRPTNAF